MPRKRQSTKSRIVKSAWNLFYKNGYDDTTVEDIITASKTSKGTFYHYFKSKEGLLNTLSYLFDEKYEELYNVVDPNLSSYDKFFFLINEFFFFMETRIAVSLVRICIQPSWSLKTNVLCPITSVFIMYGLARSYRLHWTLVNLHQLPLLKI